MTEHEEKMERLCQKYGLKYTRASFHMFAQSLSELWFKYKRDPHLNNIPLQTWDALAHSFEQYQKTGLSLAERVCMHKHAVRKMLNDIPYRDILIEKARDYNHFGMKIPGYMIEGLVDYILDHVPPGGFLTAVLCNDLYGACARSDLTNKKNLPAYIAFLMEHAPAICWGSRERFDKWVAEYFTRKSVGVETPPLREGHDLMCPHCCVELELVSKEYYKSPLREDGRTVEIIHGCPKCEYTYTDTDEED